MTEAVLRELIERLRQALDRTPEPAIPYVRISDLTPPRGPLSKCTVYRLLGQGRLRAIRLNRRTLIETASVRELLESAEQWTR